MIPVLPNLLLEARAVPEHLFGEDSRTTLAKKMQRDGTCIDADFLLTGPNVYLNLREWRKYCPGMDIVPLAETGPPFGAEEKALIVFVNQNPAFGPTLFSLNAETAYALKDGRPFGPNFSPPLFVYQASP